MQSAGQLLCFRISPNAFAMALSMNNFILRIFAVLLSSAIIIVLVRLDLTTIPAQQLLVGRESGNLWIMVVRRSWHDITSLSSDTDP